jgi:hypothetical protein
MPRAPRGQGDTEEAGRVPGEQGELWFGKKESWLGFGPLTWQGRAATYLYVLLLLVAVVTYSQLFLTVFVVAFYTVVYVFVVVAKSDVMHDRQPPPGE